MFNKVKTPAASQTFYRRNNVKSSVFGELYEQTMDKAVFNLKYARGPECRPSAFPLCSIQTLIKLATGAADGYFEREWQMAGEYFTTVGTAAHEAIQYGMGETGQVWGDWSCRNPNCSKAHRARDLYNEKGELIRKGKPTLVSTVKNKCPKCKHPMDYVEKEVDYKGIKGHVDCILKLRGGGWWVADYKTSTSGKIDRAAQDLPERAHKKQVPTYCLALEEQYDIKVYGYSILYLSRDNPFKFYEYAERWDDNLRKKTRKMVAREKKIFQAALMSLARRDAKYAIEHKPCDSKRYYETQHKCYSECPFVERCFTPKFKNEVQDLLDSIPYTEIGVTDILSRHKQILPKPLRLK